MMFMEGKMNFSDRVSLAALTVSIGSAIISGASLYVQFFSESYLTKAFITHTEYSIADGRFGRGAQLGVVFSVSNTGNRPIVIARISALFSEQSGESSGQCSDKKWQWTGASWSRKWDGDKENVVLRSFVCTRWD
jgi:hypothetical protein